MFVALNVNHNFNKAKKIQISFVLLKYLRLLLVKGRRTELQLLAVVEQEESSMVEESY